MAALGTAVTGGSFGLGAGVGSGVGTGIGAGSTIISFESVFTALELPHATKNSESNICNVFFIFLKKKL